MQERVYQGRLIKKIKDRFPGAMVVKNDSAYLQGIPDLTVMHGKRWGMLEVKVSADAPAQPNQEYYVDEMNKKSFAAFIYPENEEEVLDALQRALSPRRPARVPKRE